MWVCGVWKHQWYVCVGLEEGMDGVCVGGVCFAYSNGHKGGCVAYSLRV